MFRVYARLQKMLPARILYMANKTLGVNTIHWTKSRRSHCIASTPVFGATRNNVTEVWCVVQLQEYPPVIKIILPVEDLKNDIYGVFQNSFVMKSLDFLYERLDVWCMPYICFSLNSTGSPADGFASYVLLQSQQDREGQLPVSR